MCNFIKKSGRNRSALRFCRKRQSNKEEENVDKYFPHIKKAQREILQYIIIQNGRCNKNNGARFIFGRG